MKRLLTILMVVACISTIVSCDDSCKHEVATHHFAVDATCCATGSIEYWECDGCGKLFLNEDMTVEVSLAQTVTEKDSRNHDGAQTHHQAVASTCTVQGNIEYWECDGCDKLFSNSAMTPETEVTQEDTKVAIDANAHGTLNYNAAVAATCSKTGKVAYYECECCHKKYTDQTATTLVTNTTAPKNYTNHEGGKLTKQADYKSASCTEEGHVAYWKCDKCKKFYADSLGQTALSSVVLLRHSSDIDEETGVCSKCNNFIVTTIGDLVAAIGDGELAIGLGADIEWESCGITELDITDGTAIDFCGCTIVNIDNNILIRGNQYELSGGYVSSVDNGFYFIIGDDETTVPGVTGDPVVVDADLSAAAGTSIVLNDMHFTNLNVVVGVKNVTLNSTSIEAMNNALYFNGGSGILENVTLSVLESTALSIAGPGSVVIYGSESVYSAIGGTVVNLSRGCNLEVADGSTLSIRISEGNTSAVNLSEAASMDVNGYLDIACDVDNEFFAIGFFGDYSDPDGARFTVGDTGNFNMNYFPSYKMFGTLNDNAEAGHYVVFTDNAIVTLDGNEMPYFEDADQWFGQADFIKAQKTADNPIPASSQGQFLFFDYRVNFQ